VRVVVVGATGNVGTAVLRALEAEPKVESIVGLARRVPSGPPPPKVEWRRADVVHDELEPHFRGAACVVHLAWLIQPARDRNQTWLTNVHGSTRVFDAVAAAGVPALVYASSIGAYSPGPKAAVSESWPTGGIQTSFYSRDKSEVERRLDAWQEANPTVRVVRLRPSLIFQRAMGTEAKRLFTGRWVPHPLVSRRTIPFVPDTPRLVFQVTHSDDVAQAYRLAIVGEAEGAFNVAAEPVLDPDELSRLLRRPKLRVPERLVRAIVAATWRARLQPTPEGWVDMAFETPLLDSTRARTELGWTPARRAGDALLELLDGFHEGAGAPTPPLHP
jgi:nucleoside-diphosphate-sugar epimerase